MRIVEGRQGKNNAGKLEAVVSVPDPSSCPLVAVLTPEQGVASWTSSCSSAWRVITYNPVGPHLSKNSEWYGFCGGEVARASNQARPEG